MCQATSLNGIRIISPGLALDPGNSLANLVGTQFAREVSSNQSGQSGKVYLPAMLLHRERFRVTLPAEVAKLMVRSSLIRD